MEERKEILNDFYTNTCNEDERLQSKHGSVEFITTTEYIDRFLSPNSKIIEIGAGTGRYSIYYAKQGYDVTAVEYIKNNLDILKSKITPEMKLQADEGDAVDLVEYETNTFDATLVLGPLYHLYDEETRKKAISEAIRITKPGGIVAIAYLTSDSIMLNWGLMKDHLIDGYPSDFDENFKMKNFPGTIFAAFYVEEFNSLMKEFDNIEMLHSVATDGMTHHFKDKIDTLTNGEFNVWLKYHLSTCERTDLQGYSNHMLYIGRKK